MNCPPVPVCICTVGASRLTATWCQWTGNADKQPFYDVLIYLCFKYFMLFKCNFQISIGLVSSRCLRSKLSIYSLENEPLLDRFDLGSDAQRRSKTNGALNRRNWDSRKFRRLCCMLVSIFKHRWTMQAWRQGRAAGVVTNTGHVDVYCPYTVYSLRMNSWCWAAESQNLAA